MTFGEKLQALRKARGWSQEELATQINVSRQALSKWESGASVPDTENVVALSRLFGVSTDYLLKDELEDAEYVEGQEETQPLLRVTMAQAGEFLEAKRHTALHIARATFLCILSPICLILLGAASENGAIALSENLAVTIGLIVLLLLVAAAVAIFISCRAKTSSFDYLEHQPFETEYGVLGMVKERQRAYRDTYFRYNVFGACICILSAVFLLTGPLLSESDLVAAASLCLSLFVAGIGVMFFLVAGINWASFQKLLEEGDYTRRKKEGGDIGSVVQSVYWLVIVALYLAYSFSTDNWRQSWIIWPVAGVLSAAISILCSVWERRKGSY